MKRRQRILSTFSLIGGTIFMVSCAQIASIDEAQLDTAAAGASAGVGGAGSGGASGSGSGGAASGSLLCEEYCQTIQANCQGSLAQWADDATCELACQHFEIGTPDDQTGNTLHCRLTNAVAAKLTGEPEVHCPAAGPGGNDICGTECEGYCTMMQSVCTSPPLSEQTFASMGECLNACATVPDEGVYNASQKSGNSVQCRLWHVSAATVIAAVHCPHASGQPPCN